jgi:predicted nucleic acid-binding Zn ribbon protein
MKEREPEKISAVLPGILKKLGLEEKAADANLGGVWKDSVGPSVASHTKAVGLQNGCLLVAVDTPIWKMEMERYYKKKILNQLRQKDPRIKNIRFHIG